MAKKGKTEAGQKTADRSKRVELAVVLVALAIGGGILSRASEDWTQPPPASAFVAFAVAIAVLAFDGYARKAQAGKPKPWRRAASPKQQQPAFTRTEKKLNQELEELREENARLKKRLSLRTKHKP